MEGQRGQVFKSCDKTGWGRNREGESSRSSGLASTKKNDVCAEFFRSTNYYGWFVKDFVKMAKSLHKIMRKDMKWN